MDVFGLLSYIYAAWWLKMLGSVPEPSNMQDFLMFDRQIGFSVTENLEGIRF